MRYLLSLSLVFVSYSVFFFTNLLTSGILFSTSVNGEVVTKPVILGTLLSIWLILAS